MVKKLTKSRLIDYKKCQRSLWLRLHSQKNSTPSAITELNRSEDSNTEKLARQTFPEAIDLSSHVNNKLSATRNALQSGKIIIQPAFDIDGLYSCPDILIPDGIGWVILEVTSSGIIFEKGKLNENLETGLGFQKYVLKKAGLKINSTKIMYVNQNYIRSGPLELDLLFLIEEIKVEERNLEGIINQARWVINNREMPKELCIHPKICPTNCWDFLPNHNVFQLHRAGLLGIELYEKGILLIKDIPNDIDLTEQQCIQKKAVQTDKPYIDRDKIRKFLTQLEKPIGHLDFETFETRIPEFEGVTYRQHVPFQYSMDIEAGFKVFHREHFAGFDGDPRGVIAARLANDLNLYGSIISYNKDFENTIIRQLGQYFPQYEEIFAECIRRNVDLWEPFKQMMYYNPKQLGSTSLKTVAPIFNGGKRYNQLQITNGLDAMHTYIKMRRKKLNRSMGPFIQYCRQDTFNTIQILKGLREIAK